MKSEVWVLLVMITLGETDGIEFHTQEFDSYAQCMRASSEVWDMVVELEDRAARSGRAFPGVGVFFESRCIQRFEPFN